MISLDFQPLEPRQLLAADVTIGWGDDTARPLIGETIDVSVSFENSGDAVGFGPFIDVVVPGGEELGDGLSYVSGSAEMLGAGVNETIVSFDKNGEAEHPFAKDNSGQPVIITGNPFDKLVVCW